MLIAHTTKPEDCGVATIQPQAALVISSVANGGDIRELVAEHRVYTDSTGKARMGSGNLIGPERLADIADRLSETAARHAAEDVLPANVIAHSSNMVAWHVPSRRRPMFFASGAAQGVEAPLTCHVAWPNLLFVARGGKLWLAALESGNRPQADTSVYHAPMMNHSTQQGLCFGSVAMPAEAAVETLPDFEAAVFESYFTHCNGLNNLRYKQQRQANQQASNNAHIAFWQFIEKRRFKQFPKRHLLSAGMTVGEFIRATAQ